MILAYNIFLLSAVCLHATIKCRSSSTALHNKQSLFSRGVLGLVYRPRSICSMCELDRIWEMARLYFFSFTNSKYGSILKLHFITVYSLKIGFLSKSFKFNLHITSHCTEKARMLLYDPLSDAKSAK